MKEMNNKMTSKNRIIIIIIYKMHNPHPIKIIYNKSLKIPNLTHPTNILKVATLLQCKFYSQNHSFQQEILIS